MNKCTLVGRLTKDPELKYFGDGTPVANFTLAVNRLFKNKDGNREADFINIQVWRKQAENVANYVGKGSLVAVAGRIQTRNYENKQGQRVYITEVVADEVHFLSTNRDNKDQNKDNEPKKDEDLSEYEGELPF